MPKAPTVEQMALFLFDTRKATGTMGPHISGAGFQRWEQLPRATRDALLIEAERVLDFVDEMRATTAQIGNNGR